MSIEALETKIIQANKAYIVGAPIMSDEQFDDLLAELPEGHQLLGYLGERGSSQHTHNPPMQSLGKAKTIEDYRKSWADNHQELNPHVIVMPKLDGVACRHIYVKGQYVASYTRGDGIVGEDITQAVGRLISVPQESPFPKVDGELVIDKETFEKLKASSGYIMARNAVVGLISRNDKNAAAEAGVRFIAYAAYGSKHDTTPAPDSLFKRLQMLSSAGFCSALVYHQCKLSELSSMTIASLRLMAQSGAVDTDGIVIRFDSMSQFKSVGKTEHHPNGAIALKHPNENVWTTVSDVRWQVGRTGAITPVVEIKPVVVEGAEVSRATLHNHKTFIEFKTNAGARVELKRSGGVIPHVISIEPSDDGREFAAPEECPSCGGELRNDGTTLYCENANQAPENCKEAAVEAMCHFASVIGIEGIGPAIAEKLVEDGAVRGPDIYTAMKKGHFERLFGERTAVNIVSEIWSKIELPLSVIVEACGIDRVGKTHAKTIASRCLHTDPQLALAYFDSLAWLEGFGPVESARMKAGYQRRREIFALCLKRIKLKAAKQGGALTGKGFCFTGEIDIPRTQAESYVEDLGGICQSSVSKKTDYLVAADAEANSTKYKKAKQLQEQGHPIGILSGSEFKQLIKEARQAEIA